VDGSTKRARPPAPSSVSEQAQAWLTSGGMTGTPGPPDDPRDLEAWSSFVASADGSIQALIAAHLPDDLPVDRHAEEIGGVMTYVLRPHHVPDRPGDGIYLDVHGGALVLGGGELCGLMAVPSALGRSLVTWAVDYRMPPRHPYPAGLDDCLAVYRAALERCGPDRLVVGGASAGGNLAAATLLRARDAGLAMPAALVLLTPEVDLTESGDTFVTNHGVDNVLEPLMTTNLLYADGADLADPYLSPLFGDLSGFPPTFLQSGTRDLFLSNTVRFHRRLRDAGVDAELHVWEAMPHAGFGGTSPEDCQLAAEVRRFVDDHVAPPAA
jgi:monoterpene epsilon-lactone hydrolase